MFVLFTYIKKIAYTAVNCMSGGGYISIKYNSDIILLQMHISLFRCKYIASWTMHASDIKVQIIKILGDSLL